MPQLGPNRQPLAAEPVFDKLMVTVQAGMYAEACFTILTHLSYLVSAAELPEDVSGTADALAEDAINIVSDLQGILEKRRDSLKARHDSLKKTKEGNDDIAAE